MMMWLISIERWGYMSIVVGEGLKCGKISGQYSVAKGLATDGRNGVASA
jgi:hypothetical protein